MQLMLKATPGYDNAVTQRPRRGLLWTQLRESTRAAHAQAEASLAPLARPDSLARYAALLCTLWGFQAPDQISGQQGKPPLNRRRFAAQTVDRVEVPLDQPGGPGHLPGGDRVPDRVIGLRLSQNTLTEYADPQPLVSRV
jgi:hypothetical protein